MGFLNRLCSRENHIMPQFLRYTAVGGVSFLADAAVLALATGVCHLHYLVGNALGFSVGVALNYALSVYWVFNRRCLADRRAEVAVFVGVGILGLLLNEDLMAIFVGVLHWPIALAKVVTAALVLGWNFGVRKVLLFSEARSIPGELVRCKEGKT